jgi:hypothetical protein
MGGRNSTHEDVKYTMQNLARNLEEKRPLCVTQGSDGRKIRIKMDLVEVLD